MNAGAQSAEGDILIFLHADTRLTTGTIDFARRAIASGSGAGCFRLRFDSDSLLLRAYAAATALPLKSLCFGDRTLFVAHDLFRSVGGYADIPIFEDLDMVRRVSQEAPFVRSRLHVVTSSRRFSARGPVRQQALNLGLWTGYHMGLNPHRLSRFYRYEGEADYRNK